MKNERTPLLARKVQDGKDGAINISVAPHPALQGKEVRVGGPSRRVRVVLLTFLILAYTASIAGSVYIVLSLLGKVPKVFTGGRTRELLVGIALITTILSIPLTLYDILGHMFYYVNPLQRHYVRVLWMVIIYSCESLSALADTDAREYLETACAAYEAFTVYSFYRLCLDFVGPRSELEASLERGDIRPGQGAPKGRLARVLVDGNCCAAADDGMNGDEEETEHKGTPIVQQEGVSYQGMGKETLSAPSSLSSSPITFYASMLVPCCCLRPWKLGGPFLTFTSIGVLQYVIVRLATAIATFGLMSVGKYGENELTNPRVGYPWLVIIINTSQCWALYCLIMFGYHLWTPLGPLKPLGKFVVIKWIVFLSWWQSVVISVINSAGGLPQPAAEGEPYPLPGFDTDDDFAAGLQDTLICIEMIAAALAHHWYFNVSDFTRPDVLAKAAHLLAPIARQTPLLSPWQGGYGAGAGGPASPSPLMKGATGSDSAEPSPMLGGKDGPFSSLPAPAVVSSGSLARTLSDAEQRLHSHSGTARSSADGEREVYGRSPRGSTASRPSSPASLPGPHGQGMPARDDSSAALGFSQTLASPSQLIRAQISRTMRARSRGGTGHSDGMTNGTSVPRSLFGTNPRTLSHGAGLDVAHSPEGGRTRSLSYFDGPPSPEGASSARDGGRHSSFTEGLQHHHSFPSLRAAGLPISVHTPGSEGSAWRAASPLSAQFSPRNGKKVTLALPEGAVVHANGHAQQGHAGTLGSPRMPRSHSTGHLGFFAAVTDIVLPVDVVVDTMQHMSAAGKLAGQGIASSIRRMRTRARGGTGDKTPSASSGVGSSGAAQGAETPLLTIGTPVSSGSPYVTASAKE